MKDEKTIPIKIIISKILQILKVTKTNLNVNWLRSTMESVTGANVVVPFFSHLTLHHLKFSTVWQSINWHKILAVSTVTNWSSVMVPLIFKLNLLQYLPIANSPLRSPPPPPYSLRHYNPHTYLPIICKTLLFYFILPNSHQTMKPSSFSHQILC